MKPEHAHLALPVREGAFDCEEINYLAQPRFGKDDADDIREKESRKSQAQRSGSLGRHIR